MLGTYEMSSQCVRRSKYGASSSEDLLDGRGSHEGTLSPSEPAFTNTESVGARLGGAPDSSFARSAGSARAFGAIRRTFASSQPASESG